MSTSAYTALPDRNSCMPPTTSSHQTPIAAILLRSRCNIAVRLGSRPPGCMRCAILPQPLQQHTIQLHSGVQPPLAQLGREQAVSWPPLIHLRNVFRPINANPPPPASCTSPAQHAQQRQAVLNIPPNYPPNYPPPSIRSDPRMHVTSCTAALNFKARRPDYRGSSPASASSNRRRPQA